MVKKELQKKIDLLIEMSGSVANYETLSEELKGVVEAIEDKKSELKFLKKAINLNKYTRDNERIIDENIKVGLENKREQYLKELKFLEKKLAKASVDEEEAHNGLNQTLERLNSLKQLLETIESKLKSVHNNKELNEFYENLIEKMTKEMEQLTKKQEILNTRYQHVSELLASLSDNKINLENNLANVETRLNETIENLNNPSSYVDNDLKEADLQKIDKLNQELEDLENQKTAIVTDPVYLGQEAMNLYDLDDQTAALTTIRELVNIVKTKPYMTAKGDLKEILEQKSQKRDEFANFIENKSYLKEDVLLIDARINFLQNQIKDCQSEIDYYNEKLKKIDEITIKNIVTEIDKADEKVKILKEEINKYKEEIFSNTDNLTARRLATLQTAYKRKNEEYNMALSLVLKYQSELEKIVLDSKHINVDVIYGLEQQIQNYEKEIADLNDKKNNYNHAKDVLAMEADKVNLKKMSDDVDQIKHRLKYKVSPDEIYDEIELKLCANEKGKKEEKEVLDTEEKTDEYVDLEQFRINDILDNQEPIELKNEPIKEEEQEEVKNFPPRSLNDDRLLVTNVEQLTKVNKKEEVTSVPVIEIPKEEIESLGDLEVLEEPVIKSSDTTNNDDEYINFNDILSGDFDEN